MNESNFFCNANRMCAALEKLFEDCESKTLCHLLEKFPQWKFNDKIKRNILDNLDNIFAYGYEEIRSYEHVQKIFSLLYDVFTVKQMFESVEPNYILNCLNRGACHWVPDIDNYDIDDVVNTNAVSVGRLFLSIFIDIESAELKKALQKDILKQMQDACLVGNWLFFEMLRGFLPLLDIAEQCYESCVVMNSVIERQRWIERHWQLSEKKRKTEKK